MQTTKVAVKLLIGKTTIGATWKTEQLASPQRLLPLRVRLASTRSVQHAIARLSGATKVRITRVAQRHLTGRTPIGVMCEAQAVPPQRLLQLKVRRGNTESVRLVIA